MIINDDLSLAQQHAGRKKFLLFSFINGISFTCISGNLLTLYILKLNCLPSVAATIASFLFLGTVFAVVAKVLISKMGAVKTMAYSWSFRSIAVLFIAAVPLFNFVNAQYLTAVLLTFFSFLLYSIRSVGIGSTQPLIGEITTEDNQGTFSSLYFLFYSIATLVALSSVLILLFLNNSIVMFQMILIFGAVCGFLCSYVISGITETTQPSRSAEKVFIRHTIKKIWRNKKYRFFLLARSFSLSGIIIIIPISILVVKGMYGVSNMTALLFTLVQLFGGIIMTYFSSILSDMTGPKPLIKIYIIVLFLISLMWVFAPDDFVWWYCCIIFFLGGACFRGLSTSLLHYFLKIIPKRDNVGFTLCFTTIGGLTAGLCGVFISGGLIRLFVLLGYDASHIYRIYYLIMAFLLIPVFYITYRLTTVADWEVNKVLGLIFAPRDMQTLFVLNRIQKYSTPKSEYQNILRLEKKHSDLSEETLLYYLESPRFYVRLEALRGLRKIQFSLAAEKAIMKELQNGEYSTGYLAAIIMAEKNNKEAIPLLRKYLDSRDFYLKGTSMIGLAILKDKEKYMEIEQIFKKTENPKVLINGAVALSKMNDFKMVGTLLEKSLMSVCPEKLIRDEIIYCAAELTGYGDDFYKILRIYEKNQKNGLMSVIDYLSDLKAFDCKLQSPDKILIRHFHNEINNAELVEYLQTYSKHIENTTTVTTILHFINKVDPFDISNASFFYMFIVFCDNWK
ncbi:MAG TPA: MFS transporter [Victivallales bacterium]|nr:MFS transporter [Victivallales bacterium]